MSLLSQLLMLLSIMLLPLLSPVLADDFVVGQQWSRWLGRTIYQVERRQHVALPMDSRVWIVGEQTVGEQTVGEQTNPLIGDALYKILASQFASVELSTVSMDLTLARQQASLKAVDSASLRSQGSFLFYYRLHQFHQGYWFVDKNCPDVGWRGRLCRLRPHNPIDKVELTVWILDAANGRLMDTVTLRAQSSVLSWWNQNLVDLIDAPLRQVLSSYSANIN